MVPVDEFISQKSWRGAQKGRNAMLSETKPSLLKSLKRAAESGIEISMETGETRERFPRIILCCCDTHDAKNESEIRRGAGRQHPLHQVPQNVRCYGSGQKVLRPRGDRDDGQATKLKKLQEKAVNLAGRVRSRRRQEIRDEKNSLLSEQSQWPSFLDERCEGSGVAVENVYSIFTFRAFHHLLLIISRLLNTCCVHCLPFHDMDSSPEGSI